MKPERPPRPRGFKKKGKGPHLSKMGIHHAKDGLKFKLKLHLPFGMRKELKCSVMASFQGACYRDPGPTCFMFGVWNRVIWFDKASFYALSQSILEENESSLQSTTSALITQKVNVQNLPKLTVFFQLNRRRT